jgi:phosphatidylinositol N-acetylglucosaminyltransferase subunit H
VVLRTLGIQTSTSSSTYLSTSTTRFIPTSQIQDIFIHEAFKGFEVRYYLAVVVQGEGEVIVVFPVCLGLRPAQTVEADQGPLSKTLLPRLGIVEEVWRGARACLFEPSSSASRENAKAP